MSEPVRLSNRRQFRPPLLWGGSALFMGSALLALSSWLLPDSFKAVRSTAVAQASGAALALLGIGIISYALARHVLWVEFGERIRVRRALSERGIEWTEVASVALELEKREVSPLAALGVLPDALGAPDAVGRVVELTGAADFASFDLITRRLCLRVKGGGVIRCDVRLLEWERVAGLARSRAVAVSPG